VITSAATTHEPGCPCQQCAGGQRNRFFKGKLMKAPEFAMEQRYSIERRRLLTREVTGPGVVRGFALRGARRGEPKDFVVTAGLAFDDQGREILLEGETILSGENTFVIVRSCELKSLEKLEPGKYLLAVHYAEHRFGDASMSGDCCDTKAEKNYVCEGALFSLRKLCPDCPCGEPPCPQPCACPQHEYACGDPGRGATLGCWTARAEAPSAPQKPCRWRDHEVWVEEGVDLACLCVYEHEDKCHPPLGLIEDDVAPRRMVKNNQLLYDLIRGCGLTRIKCLSWGAWHRARDPVPWSEFEALLKGSGPAPGTGGVRCTGFEVLFTGPVKSETLRPDCFSIYFTIGHNWGEILSVEIVGVELLRHDDYPQHWAYGAVLCVRDEWMEDAVCYGSRIRKHGAAVRIEVRGDYILDCHGQPIDANAHGFHLQGHDCEKVKPGGNGTPGGTLQSLFRVAKAEAESR
jgi:hypothetical protein